MSKTAPTLILHKFNETDDVSVLLAAFAIASFVPTAHPSIGSHKRSDQQNGSKLAHFLLALLLFLVLHIVPAFPPLRARLVAIAGLRGYLFAYSVVSLLMLGWIFHGAMQLDFVPLWDTAGWQAWVTIVLTPIAMFLLLAGLLSPNPVSVTLRGPTTEVGAVTAITRHPVLWGFALWTGSHLAPNGDLRSLLLFGSLFVFALVGIWISERRAGRRLSDQWSRFVTTTSIVPFVAIITGRTPLRVDGPLIVGLLGSTIITIWLLVGGHAALFNADPLLLTAL